MNSLKRPMTQADLDNAIEDLAWAINERHDAIIALDAIQGFRAAGDCQRLQNKVSRIKSALDATQSNA